MSSKKQIIILEAIMPNRTQTYEIDKSEAVFGRGGKSDIVVKDAGISREHMKLKLVNGVPHVMDLGSLNGVYVDGYKINPDNYIAVQQNCILTFGKCAVSVKIRVEGTAGEDTVLISPVKAEEVKIPETPPEKFTPEPLAEIAAEKPAEKISEKTEHYVDPVAVPFIDLKGIEDAEPVVHVEPQQRLETEIYEIPKVQAQPEPVPEPIIEVKPEPKIEPKPAPKIEAKAKPPEVKMEVAVPPSAPSEVRPRVEVRAEKPEVQDEADKPVFNKLMDLSAFPKTEEDYRINFKNVGLDLPKYKNPGEHAKEIIQEAEYQKYAIIKSAEVAKSKIVNDTRILSKKASDEAYAEYKRLVDHLLETTRKELKKLRTDTEVLLDGKRLQANEEIQRVWQEHDELIRKEKDRQMSTFEKENKIKLDLSIEKTRSDMFAERHKLLTDAETEILKRKIQFQADFENEKNEHIKRAKIYGEELQKTQESIEENKKIFKDSKMLRDEAEIELSKVTSLLKAEKENLQIITDSFKETQESHKAIESELNSFNQNKNSALAEISKAREDLAKLNMSFSIMSEKKQILEAEMSKLNDQVKDSKLKAKAELENEYAALKSTEAKKFDDFKANELKELQKIRDAHNDSIKNFSVDLSQEIATKLELLSTKSGAGKFDFEKNFELINSVIQIKGALNTGSESKHAQQLENWKNRKRKEDYTLISKGFMMGLVCIFAAKFVYDKIHIDPVKEEMAQMALDNRKRDTENKFIPTKSDKYFDSYVETTLYTERFAEVYLDAKNQQEWVTYATRYFLRQWKVEEEKVISVISNSNALVQNINENIPNLKKSRIKNDIAKLKELEDEYVQKQANILGTNVKYEAYKKIEKDFFKAKIQGRIPASQ